MNWFAGVKIRERMILRAAVGARRLKNRADDLKRFVLSRAGDDGGFSGRSSSSDLYYTAFAMQILAAMESPFPPGAVEYVLSHKNVRSLDLVHLSCFARCLAMIATGATKFAPEVFRDIKKRLADFCCDDGGYHHIAAADRGTAYGCFLAVGTMQDINAKISAEDSVRIASCLDSLRCDGGYANEPALPFAISLATAAATAVRDALHLPVDVKSLAWLARQQGDDGGFLSIPIAPTGDLLATATSLLALDVGGKKISAAARQRCGEYIENLWRDGGFGGAIGDSAADCEYSFYGILSLGLLSSSGAK